MPFTAAGTGLVQEMAIVSTAGPNLPDALSLGTL
jgi:hypothetical protein